MDAANAKIVCWYHIMRNALEDSEWVRPIELRKFLLKRICKVQVQLSRALTRQSQSPHLAHFDPTHHHNPLIPFLKVMPLSSQVTTRTTNNNLHPGAVDQPRRRRTKAEMAAFRSEEAEKKLQKELEKQAKVDRIAELEKVLENDSELEATPRPNFKRKLRRCKAYQNLEVPINGGSKGSKDDSQVADQDFEPTSGNEVTTAESGAETELDTPLKKKKKVDKEPMRARIKAARSVMVNNEGTAKEGPDKEPLADAGKEVPHGSRVSARVTNGAQIKVTKR
jgi:hypothetical protein